MRNALTMLAATAVAALLLAGCGRSPMSVAYRGDAPPKVGYDAPKLQGDNGAQGTGPSGQAGGGTGAGSGSGPK